MEQLLCSQNDALKELYLELRKLGFKIMFSTTGEKHHHGVGQNYHLMVGQCECDMLQDVDSETAIRGFYYRVKNGNYARLLNGPIVAAAAMIYDPRADTFLIGRRIGDEEGTYGFVGGKQHVGERLEECLKRELREEAGCEIPVTWAHVTYFDLFKPQDHVVCHVFAVLIPESFTPRNMEPHKCHGWEWHRRTSLPETAQQSYLMRCCVEDGLFDRIGGTYQGEHRNRVRTP